MLRALVELLPELDADVLDLTRAERNWEMFPVIR